MEVMRCRHSNLTNVSGNLNPPARLHVAGGACPDPVLTCNIAFNSLIQLV